jgi:hypothetical protein
MLSENNIRIHDHHDHCNARQPIFAHAVTNPSRSIILNAVALSATHHSSLATIHTTTHKKCHILPHFATFPLLTDWLHDDF